MNEVQKAVLFSQIAPASKVDRSKSIAPSSSSSSETGFESALHKAEVQFSKHAEKRLHSRNIQLTEADRARLTDAVDSLEKKGARDSLILMGDLGFIANIPSKTIVTAIAREQMKEQVFTNIDSTMLV